LTGEPDAGTIFGEVTDLDVAPPFGHTSRILSGPSADAILLGLIALLPR
jgi:hypothetical protein